MNWHPHVTVASVVQQHDRFLLVHEQTEQGLVFNQPAGHLEQGESLVQAAARETLEETRWQVNITHVLGISHLVAANGVTYIRVSFVASPLQEHRSRSLDQGIIDTVWWDYPTLRAHESQLRSAMVRTDIERFRAGVRYPLELITTLALK